MTEIIMGMVNGSLEMSFCLQLYVFIAFVDD